MRVLVVLSVLVGVACAGQVALPLVYARTAATHFLEPRHAFEYSSSVQTADYANFAAVKSDNAGVATVVQTVPSIAIPSPAVVAAPLATVRAIAEPAPIVEHVVEHVAPALLAVERSSQYHSQDSLGQAAYGHSEQLQSHDAVQDAAGNKAGAYSYVAPDGRVLTTSYVADANGYRVATNALPIDPNHPLVVSSRRRRALIAGLSVASVPVVKEATSIDIAGHSSTRRLDTHNVNVVSAVHTVPTTVYAAPHALTYAAYHQPAAIGTYLY